jgi:hypothetical protein
MSYRALGRCGAVGLLITAALLLASGAWANANSAAIGPGDWQYADLDALAQAGLLAGHPKGPINDWAGDRLSRYEAASLTLRAVEGIGTAYQQQGEKLHQIAQADGAEAPPQTMVVSGADLARVEKLIAEFRAELVTMGARVDDLETAVKDVQSRLAKVEADQKKHKLDGYFQVRYSIDNATDESEFLVRRARLNIRGPVSNRWSYRMELQMDAKEDGKGPDSKTQLRTINADYKLENGYLRVGQAKIPWGYELLEAVPDLWTSERSFFMDRLFPNQRDVGVTYVYQSAKDKPEFDAGIYNGTGINTYDNNKDKNLLARVNVPIKNGSAAVSAYVGKNGEGASQTDQDRYGPSLRFDLPQGTKFMGELVVGQDKGHDVDGWYAQVGHPVTKAKPNLLFAKYDQYDENNDASDDLFKRWSLGYWYELDPATRLTLVYELRRPQPAFSEFSKYDGNAAYMQLQVKY